MSITASRLVAQVAAEGVEATQSALNSVGRTVDKLGAGFVAGAGAALGWAAVTPVIHAVGAGFDMLGSSAIGLNAKLEAARIGFTTMLGSASQADIMLRNLAKFAQTTPYEFPDLVRASQRMMAMGFSAQSILPTLTAIGDAASATGGITATALDRITLAIGQIQTKGRVMAQEMNQLTEANIPAWQILADKMGITTQKLQQMVENGAVPAGKAIKDLTEGMEERFGGQMKRASETFIGAMSNIKDAVGMAVATAFKPGFAAISELANGIAKFTQSGSFQQWASAARIEVERLVAAIRALFNSDFDKAGAQWELFLAPLQQLAGMAFDWGWGVVTAFAQGMLEGAAASIVAAATAIGEMIAEFFASFSPPKRGPLSEIDTWGANLINTYMGGMQNADFEILNKVTEGIRDALKVGFQAGDFGEEGIIPRLLGGMGVVTQAISELKEFGQVSEETFTRLAETVGRGGSEVVELTRNLMDLAKTQSELDKIDDAMDNIDSQLRDLKAPIRQLEGDLRDLTKAYEDFTKPIEKDIARWERYYDAQIKNSDRLIANIERQIKAREKELGLVGDPAEKALDKDIASLQVAKDKADLTEAENAHLTRGAKIREDINKAETELAKIRRELAQAEAKTGKDRDPDKIADMRTQEAQKMQSILELNEKLNKEGQQTDEDRLRIANLRRDILRDEKDLVRLTDPNLEALNQSLTTQKEQRDVLKEQKEDIIDPMKDRLDDIKQAYQDAKDNIEDQLEPLRDQRDILQNQKDILQDQRDDMADLLSKQQEAVNLSANRLRLEGQVSDLLKEQQELLARQAEEGSKAGGGGGGAGKGGGLGGLPTIKAPLKDEGQFMGPEQTLEGLLASWKIKSDQTLEKFKQDISDAVAKAVKEGISKGFEKATTGDTENQTKIIKLFTILGGAVGILLSGSPFGAIIGAAAGNVMARGLTDWIDEHMWDIKRDYTDRIWAILGGFGSESQADQAAKLKTAFGNMIKGIVSEGLDLAKTIIKTEYNMAEFAQGIIDGIVGGFGDLAGTTLKTLGGALQSWFEEGFRFISGWLVMHSPSQKAADEIGKPFIEGIFQGMQEAWDGGVHFLEELPQKAFDAIGTVTSTLVDKGTDLVQGLWDGAKNLWDGDVTKWFNETGNRSTSAVGVVTETLQSKGTDLIQGLWNGAKNLWDGDVNSWLVDTGNRAFTAVGNVLGSLVVKGSDLMEGLFKGIKDLWDFAGGPREWLADLGNKALAAVPNLTRTLYQKGRDIIDGFLSGITDAGTTIGSTIANVINTGVNAGIRAGQAAGSAVQPKIGITPGTKVMAMGDSWVTEQQGRAPTGPWGSWSFRPGWGWTTQPPEQGPGGWGWTTPPPEQGPGPQGAGGGGVSGVPMQAGTPEKGGVSASGRVVQAEGTTSAGFTMTAAAKAALDAGEAMLADAMHDAAVGGFAREWAPFGGPGSTQDFFRRGSSRTRNANPFGGPFGGGGLAEMGAWDEFLRDAQYRTMQAGDNEEESRKLNEDILKTLQDIRDGGRNDRRQIIVKVLIGQQEFRNFMVDTVENDMAGVRG